MPLVSKPYNYANGQTIDANQLNQDLDTLYNLINGLLDAVNIAANGLNDPNKFASEVITQAKSKGLVYTQDLYGQSWVVSGGVTTASGSPANQITVTTLVANILQADGSYRHVTVAGTTYVTSIINATYFLDLQPDGTMSWAQTHSAQANYMPIATVTSNASGNINVITDTRVTTKAFNGLTKFDNGSSDQIVKIFGGRTNNIIRLLFSNSYWADNGTSGQSYIRSTDTGVSGGDLIIGTTTNGGGTTGVPTDKFFVRNNGKIESLNNVFDDAAGNQTVAGNATITGALTVGAGGSFSSSMNNLGYQKFPGGLLQQWGNAVIGTTATTFNLPIGAPGGNFIAIGTPGSTNPAVTCTVSSWTATTVTMYCSAASTTVYFFVVGKQ